MIEAEDRVRRVAAKKTADKKGFGAPTVAAAAAASETQAFESDEQIDSAVRLNAFGMAHGDLVASHCRGEQKAAFLGIWPEAALINHRCSKQVTQLHVSGN